MASFTSYCLACARAIDADELHDDSAFCSTECKHTATAQARKEEIEYWLSSSASSTSSHLAQQTGPVSDSRSTPHHSVARVRRSQNSPPSSASVSSAQQSSGSNKRPSLFLRHSVARLETSAGSNLNFALHGIGSPATLTGSGITQAGPPSPSVEQVYRELYPKFAPRRNIESSPRSRPMDLSFTGSTMSEAILMSPPPLVAQSLQQSSRSFSTGETYGGSAVLRTSSNGSSISSSRLRRTDTQPPRFKSIPLQISPLLRPAPTNGMDLDTPAYIDRRSSAPKRTFDIHQAGQTVLPIRQPSYNRRVTSSVLANFGGLSNSLGLEISHVETVASPPHSPNGFAQPAPGSPVNARLASAISQLNMSAEGWRSVEACKYTLGEKESTYIRHKLAEEQRKRQNVERRAMAEERGRSRDRKRAYSISAV